VPGDRVSDGALRQRVLNAEGAICRNPTNKPQPEHDKSARIFAYSERSRAIPLQK
jgi:hypothetical protein